MFAGPGSVPYQINSQLLALRELLKREYSQQTVSPVSQHELSEELAEQLKADARRSWKILVFTGQKECAGSAVNITGKLFQSAFYKLLTDVCGESYYQGFADVLEIVCIANLNPRLFFNQDKQTQLQAQFQAMVSSSQELVENELVPLK